LALGDSNFVNISRYGEAILPGNLARPLHKGVGGISRKKILSLQGGSKMGLLHHKRFFRPDEAASILALSRRTVYRMIRDGRITGVKWGKGPWRIPRDSLAILLPGEKF